MTIWQRSAWWQDTGALRRLVADLAGMGPPAAAAAAIATFFCIDDSAAVAGALQQPDWPTALQAILPTTGGMLGFLTSGTSGEPKPIRQSAARLDEETAFQLELQGQPKRVVSLVPAHHIYGFLFTVLLPYRAAAPVLDLRDRRPAAILERLEPGDLLIGFPEAWKALAQTAQQGRRRLPPDIRGITSTAPCPSDVARTVRAAGFARLVELYGSSETMGIGWRDDPDRPYRLFPYWRLEDDATLLRHTDQGFGVNLPDRIALADGDDRAFFVRGRRDGAIQIGGINVHPDRIAALLRSHPAIAAAAVRPYRAGATLRLKAFLVPAEDGTDLAALRREIEAWLRDRLPPIERPRSLTFGAVLPQGAMGKLADW